MSRRLELHSVLVDILGSSHVYFQPPENVTMQYPCIVYERDTVRSEFADSLPYLRTKAYSVTYIGKDPDSSIPDVIGSLPMCSFSTHFTSDNLNHDVFRLYF